MSNLKTFCDGRVDQIASCFSGRKNALHWHTGEIFNDEKWGLCRFYECILQTEKSIRKEEEILKILVSEQKMKKQSYICIIHTRKRKGIRH